MGKRLTNKQLRRKVARIQKEISEDLEVTELEKELRKKKRKRFGLF